MVKKAILPGSARVAMEAIEGEEEVGEEEGEGINQTTEISDQETMGGMILLQEEGETTHGRLRREGAEEETIQVPGHLR